MRPHERSRFTESMFEIRQTRLTDAITLPSIERSAGQTFRTIQDLAWLADEDDVTVERHRELIAQGMCWVAVDNKDVPIAYLSGEVISSDFHISELYVHLDRQRRGLGGRLIEHALGEARRRGFDSASLTTFRDVPWNAPFYARFGFEVLNECDAGLWLTAVLCAERERGLPPDRRCAMRLTLNSSPVERRADLAT